MSRILIVKLGAAGDVVRTTPILTLFVDDDVDWIASPSNAPLLKGTSACIISSMEEMAVAEPYDLVVSLEEDFRDLSRIFSRISFKQVIGAYPTVDGKILYTSELNQWFDMSLISTYGRTEANRMKLQNRRTYQEILFQGLGAEFAGEEYLLPGPAVSTLRGDIALINLAGKRWPNKIWGHMELLATNLAAIGSVNILPFRDSVLDHLGDIDNHRIVVTPDSLPLHLGIGLNKATIGIFNCTSPWEIFPYRTMEGLISPRLGEFFYGTEFVEEATVALPLDAVCKAVIARLSVPDGSSGRQAT